MKRNRSGDQELDRNEDKANNSAHSSDFDLNNPELPANFKERAFTSGQYPYESSMKSKDYEPELRTLQIELVKLQRFVRDEGRRIVVVLEGRDAAGKGGTINAIRENMNPRYTRVEALAKPTEHERGQWYFQRYINRLPTAGEIVLFDRSWYNRGVVEPVMGFCTKEQTEEFLVEAPRFESMLVNDGVILVKFWLNVGREMQLKRFHDRRHDPLKVWKLSPVDLKALGMWDEYTNARDRMIEMTHTDFSPWTIIRSNDKKRLRINAIRHVLKLFDYPDKDRAAIGEVDNQIVGQGSGFLLSGEE
ncbi:MAG: polyphosphate kinase 2 [Stappiaceae bacterium]